MQFPIRTIGPKDYPPLLRQIPDMPKHLHIRGTLPSFDLKYLCVVGSRSCSVYGKRWTQKLIAGLAQYPVAIISGMALGIDAEVHRTALDVGLPTVACLPSSLDDKSIYPAMNQPLAKRILAQGGALTSENEAPYKANLFDFPKRNRVMSGMSIATLIIEAGEKSGTLITARLALDYNREVLAIPHSLESEKGSGVNKLLREGATLVRSSDDILQVLGLTPHDNPVQGTLPTDLTEPEIKVVTALTAPMVRDDLIAQTELSAQDASVALSSLLIRGLITERLGKIERV